jgi:cytochrome c oxidase subunit 3
MTGAAVPVNGGAGVPHAAAARHGPGARVAAQFDDARQQADAATLGMWLFIATEMLFFGVLFFVYALGRSYYPDAFAAASRHTRFWLGTVNTGVLLTSSFAMAAAVRSAQLRAHRTAALLLVLTAVLGVAFACIKLTEYWLDWQDRLVPVLNFAFEPQHAKGALAFFWLYFATTGMHLVHLSIGVVIVLVFAWREWHPASARLHEQVEIAGLYWHFVDLVWIFLYPCLYLIARW